MTRHDGDESTDRLQRHDSVDRLSTTSGRRATGRRWKTSAIPGRPAATVASVEAMAWALVVVLGLVAVGASLWLLSARSKLAAQRAAVAAAEQAAADAAARATETAAHAEARVADIEAGAAEAARASAEEIESLHAALDEAAARVRQAERDRAIDPEVLWSLERARSERTWRFSVAVGPDSVSVLHETGPDETSRALVEALRVELDAAREEVGAVVDLEADVPPGVSPAGAVIALRIAQELLADVVRRGESTVLRVSAAGEDLLVAVESTDEDGTPVVPAPLPLPPSPSIDVGDGGASVRIIGAAASQPADSPVAADLDTTREIVAPDTSGIADDA